jgi:hypothetical protein
VAAAQDLLLGMLDNPKFGGPHSLRVTVGKGPSGQRGTFIFLSPGDPNSTPLIQAFPDSSGSPILVPAQEIQRFDICLSVSPEDPSSLVAFSYQDGPQGLRWYPAVNLAPEGFVKNEAVSFSEGIGRFVVLARLPAIAESAIASAALVEGFDLGVFLQFLQNQIASSLIVGVTVINETPVAQSTVLDDEAESPVFISYDGSSPGQYSAIIVEGSKEVALTSGTTTTISIGQKLFKQSGTGELGSDPIVTSITSNTRFTVSSSHLSSGSITFTSKSADVLLSYKVAATESAQDEFGAISWNNLEGDRILHVLVANAQA